MAEHSDLPDAERHEPKGASTAVNNSVLKSNGDTTTSFGFVNYSEILNRPTAGSAVANATNADDVIDQLNALLASLRAAGYIAT